MILDAAVDPAAMQPFFDLPSEVYRHDPEYCPASLEAVRESVFRKQFDGRQAVLVSCRSQLRQATAGARTIGRVVARLSANLRDPHGRPLGMLGFFEAHDEPRPVAELLRAGVDWLRARGAGDIVGPLDGDTWHRYRFNVGPFDRPPFLMEPYNRPFYPDLWQQAGFAPLEHYYSKHVGNAAAAEHELRPILDRVVRRGYALRTLDLGRYEQELALLYELSTAIFAENFLYEPIALDEFLAMYLPLRPFIDADFVRFAVAPGGAAVGFAFSVVDYHQAVQAMRGKRNLAVGWTSSPSGFDETDWKSILPRADTVNIKSLGVLPVHRKSGLGAALMCQAYADALAKGFHKVNLCLIRDDNPSGRLDGGQGEIMRRYILYKYSPLSVGWTSSPSES